MGLFSIIFTPRAIRHERNRFLVSIFAGIFGFLLVGCGQQSSSDQTSSQQPVVSTVNNVKFETQTDRITKNWGPHRKVSESKFSWSEVKVGMDFAQFESILNSQGFLNERFLATTHYAGENRNCREMSTYLDYFFGKVEIVNEKSLLQYVEVTACISEKDPKVRLLESDPILEIYEITNAKN